MSLDRRTFLKKSIAAAGVLSFGSAGSLWGSSLNSATNEVSIASLSEPLTTISVIKGNDAYAITKRAVDELGGISKFVKSGQSVVIKPNMGWDRPPQMAADTNPDVVRALVEMCKSAGASRIEVFDLTCHNPQRCYKNSGIEDAAKRAGAEVSFMDKKKFVDYPIPDGKALKSWPLYKPAMDADVYINVPIAKNHSLSKLTICMKNAMGIMGGNRGEIHWNLDQKLADFATVIKPTLNVVDCTRVLLRNGPSGGSMKDVDFPRTVLAGTDQVALDSYTTRFFNMKPADLGYIKAAADMGIGTMDLDKVKQINVELS